jgi:hypothetical protein
VTPSNSETVLRFGGTSSGSKSKLRNKRVELGGKLRAVSELYTPQDRKKVKIFLLQPVEAPRVARGRGSHSS